MSEFNFEIGGESSEYILLPEVDGVRVRFLQPERNKFNEKALRFPFQIEHDDYDGGDSEDVDEAIQEASANAFIHYENVNIPEGKIGKRTKLYKFLKWFSGGDFDEGSRVDLDQFVSKTYLADFEHVNKMMPDGTGKFAEVRDDAGRPIKKAAIAKLKPERKAKKTSTKAKKVEAPVDPDIPDDDDDIDLDEEE